MGVSTEPTVGVVVIMVVMSVRSHIFYPVTPRHLLKVY